VVFCGPARGFNKRNLDILAVRFKLLRPFLHKEFIVLSTKGIFAVCLSLSLFTFAAAGQTPPPPPGTPPDAPPPGSAPSSGGAYIVDENAPINGDPGPLEKDARANWKKACDDWKKETKELNKGNVISLSCNTPACSMTDTTSYSCSSTAKYKVKVTGVAMPEQPIPPPPPPQQVVTQVEPPPPVVEITPDPRPGFIWVTGYWGWYGGHHTWYPGHWMPSRPGYVWIGHRWVHRGGGWGYEPGHWHR
jgi:hypothetical protein